MNTLLLLVQGKFSQAKMLKAHSYKAEIVQMQGN